MPNVRVYRKEGESWVEVAYLSLSHPPKVGDVYDFPRKVNGANKYRVVSVDGGSVYTTAAAKGTTRRRVTIIQGGGKPPV